MAQLLEQLEQEENSQYLFHFCKLNERKMESILNSQIYLGDVRNFNDPFELYFLNSTNPTDWEELAKEYCKEHDVTYDEDTFQKFINQMSLFSQEN
jgi:hypothetical protein